MEPSEQENLSVQNENQSIHSHQENLEQSQKQEEQENKDLYESGAYEDRIPTENQEKKEEENLTEKKEPEIPKRIIPPLDEKQLWSICPKCKNWPIIEPLIENGTALIKLTCKCEKMPQKYSYDEYINLLKEKKKKLVSCDMNKSHSIYNAVTYCFECDKWLCSFCDSIHKNINPNHTTSDERTYLNYGCQRHTENNYIIGFCEDCQMHLCQTCYDQHDKLHTIDLFNEYFPKELADKTYEKFNKVKSDFEMKLNQNRLEIYQKIDEEGDIRNQLPFVEKVCNSNIKICNELVKIIQFLFDNYYNTIENYLNYNIITNIKRLSNFNDKFFKFNDELPLYKNIDNFMNFYKENYLFKSTSTPFTLKEIFKSPGDIYSVDKLLLLPNDRIAVGDWSGWIELFDMNERRLIGILYGHFQGITTMCYLNNGHLLTGSKDFSVNEWDLDNLDFIKSYPSHNEKVSKVLQLKDGKILTAGWDKIINIYDNTNDKLVKSIKENDFINDVIQLKNGHLIVLVKNKKIKELCPKTFNVLKEYDIGENPLNAIQLLDGRLVISCINDKKVSSIKLVCPEKWEITKEFKEHSKIITSLYLLNDGRYVSTSFDGSAVIYGLEPDSVVCKYNRQYGTGLNSCIQLRDNSIVLAGINDSLDILD